MEDKSIYSFCNSDDCIHRRGCRRWKGNYEGNIVAKFWIKPTDCINSKPYPYGFLDRFRNSDGSEQDDTGKKD